VHQEEDHVAQREWLHDQLGLKIPAQYRVHRLGQEACFDDVILFRAQLSPPHSVT
jgi:hypothetical protein